MSTEIQSLPRVSKEYIAIDDEGQARLAGHRIKVKHIVALKFAHDYTPDQIHSEAYPHLSLSQIYAALAYYYDHQAEIDRQMLEDREFAERERLKQEADPKYQALRAKIEARRHELGR